MADYAELMKKVQSEHCSCYEEANDVLMTKLRIKCELMQLDHQHGKESEVSLLVTQPAHLSVSARYTNNLSLTSSLHKIVYSRAYGVSIQWRHWILITLNMVGKLLVPTQYWCGHYSNSFATLLGWVPFQLPPLRGFKLLVRLCFSTFFPQ